MRRLKKKLKNSLKKTNSVKLILVRKYYNLAHLLKKEKEELPRSQNSHIILLHTPWFTFFLRENVSHKKTKTFVCLENAITHLS